MNRRRLLGSALASGLVATPPARALADPPRITVYKSPWCGCCEAWVDHVRAAGFAAEVHDVEDLAAIKRLAGVPDRLGSCHTASVSGYAIEGHVPADVIRRLLDERPAVRGLAVPGMPVGSPGMEGPSPEPYTVYSFADGRRPDRYAVIRP
jgi:hypothetical protein